MTDNGVLVLAGPPCAGKSSVARLLAADPWDSRRICVEVDSLFSMLLPDSDRNREDRMLAYDGAHGLARMLIARGRSPVLECTYGRLAQRASLLQAMADVPAAPVWVVEFYVSPHEAVQRFRLRDQATDLNERQVRDKAASYPYFDQSLRLDSAAASLDDHARHISTWLSHRPRSVQRDQWAAAGQGWD